MFINLAANLSNSISLHSQLRFFSLVSNVFTSYRTKAQNDLTSLLILQGPRWEIEKGSTSILCCTCSCLSIAPVPRKDGEGGSREGSLYPRNALRKKQPLFSFL